MRIPRRLGTLRREKLGGCEEICFRLDLILRVQSCQCLIHLQGYMTRFSWFFREVITCDTAVACLTRSPYEPRPDESVLTRNQFPASFGEQVRQLRKVRWFVHGVTNVRRQISLKVFDFCGRQSGTSTPSRYGSRITTSRQIAVLRAYVTCRSWC